VSRLRDFAVNADPLAKQLVPVAEELSPTLIAFGKLAPEAKKLFEALPAVEKEAPTGFPALRKLFRDDFPPLLRASEPFVRNLDPLVVGLGLYKKEVTAFFANLAVTTNGELPETNAAGQKIHFLRALGPINAESIASYPSRLALNRNSAYSPPGWAEGVMAGLPVFNTANCSTGLIAELDPNSAKSPAFVERITKKGTKLNPEATNEEEEVTYSEAEIAAKSESLFNRIKQFAFGGQSSTAAAPTPACQQQAKIESIYGTGEKTQYQHTYEQTGR
jgi:hypothetical protein